MSVSAADQILAALGGGLEGASTYALKRKEIDNKQEIARLNGELKLMLEQVRSFDRQDAEAGRDRRWTTPSGNVTAQQSGQTQRNDADNTSAETIAGMRDSTTRRGQDITELLGVLRDETTRRGQDITELLGMVRNMTTQRGQNMTAETAKNGQKVTQQVSADAEAGRNRRATDANKLRQDEINLRREIEAKQKRSPWDPAPATTPPKEVKEGTVTKPTATPVEVVEKPIDTSRLPDAGARSPEADGDQSARLEQQARSLIEKYKATSDPAQKAALRTQLERIKADLLKMQTKPTGQR